MRFQIAAAFIMVSAGQGGVSAAAEGMTVVMAMEYSPLARLSYQNGSDLEYEIVDNISWEPGIYYNFTTGFRTGAFFQYYRKNTTAGTTEHKLSSWGIGILNDYGYEVTESGKTLLVAGMEAGYGELRDKNEFSDRTGGSLWIAGILGLRYFFAQDFSLELDYRVKWNQYDLPGEPAKSYDYSGSTLRLSVAYRVFSSGRKGKDQDNEKATVH